MTASRDPDRLIHAFLNEGLDELPDPVYDAVRDRIEQTRQRAVIGPWRTPIVNKFVPYGLAVAAVAVVAIIGSQLIRSPSSGLPGSPHVLLEGTDSGVPVTVTIPTPLWDGEPNGGVLCWGDPAKTCPGPSDGAGIFAFEGREYHVYGDACHRPPLGDTTATTVDELVNALARQVHRWAYGVEDITVDGYAGKMVRLYMAPVPGDCDYDDSRTAYVLFGLPGDDPARLSQAQDQIEEVWALDVDGLVVVLNGSYYAGTPQKVVDELRTILSSATFD
jgi:hypothetical protein